MKPSALLSECAEIIAEKMPREGSMATEIAGLNLYRRETDETIECDSGQIMVAFIAQGCKETLMTGKRFVYEQGQCLLSGVAAPASFHAVQADKAHPFLSMSLRLDVQTLVDCASQAPLPPPQNVVIGCVFVFDGTDALCDAFLRLLRLLREPNQAAFLAPLIIREIHYRLFFSPVGGALRSLASVNTQSHAVLRAVSWMKQHYTQAFKVNEMAEMVHMSVSAFHRQFKAVTGMSPLQFQKQIRLFEAQRMMLNAQANVSSAAYAVGYESPTQFIREYRRQFGRPPLRDIRQRQGQIA